ncbi:MAG: hypothetical protein IJW70_02120 [Clostridia bacterium]|nr:hypothetical protein [Clostridia bacterium]
MSYPINFWYGIRPEFISRERVAEAARAGFTIIECRYDTATNKKVLRWCEELGLRAYVWDDRMAAAINETEGWQQTLDQMIADYADFPALDRFFIKDEPVEAQFPMLARIADYFHTHHPNADFYVNLLPNAAVPGGKQNSDAHIAQYLDMVKPSLLSYDHYCLCKTEVAADELFSKGLREARVSDECRERNGTQNTVYAEHDRPDYFDNLEQIRTHAKKAGIPWMIIILLVEHWGYRYLTEAEIRWEVFTALAYGSSQISYFTYWTPGVAHTEPWSYHHGIIEADGTRGEKYPVVKQINREIQAVMAEIGNAQSTAVFHTGEERDPLPVSFAPYGGIDTIEGGRFVVGFFEGGYMMLANKDFRGEAFAKIKTDKTLYKFSKARGVWDQMPQTADDTYNVHLHAGDGALLRIE